MSFDNLTVIVTGGGRGIGRAITERFACEGAHVFVLDIDTARTDLGSDSATIELIRCDISVADEVKSAISAIVKDTGRVDVLVNNAGIIRDNVIWRMTEEEFDEVIGVNLKGSWLMCREVAPVMRKQNNGRIINIASRAWLGNFGQSNYSASKGGLVSMTRVLALELARFNVTVNAVAPGVIDTPMTRDLPEKALRELIEAQPGQKIGHVDDIAHAVAFLASANAGFITGQVLHIDGGKSIGANVH